ncbi:MAG TPA: hypothetical protein VMU62_05135, partial [Acidobacteriaceae bacterium]|nr:hypothetical protein [Acidobacteriaceae bacterium]
ISAAPLWAGNDLTNMTDSIRNIYTNSEAIAVDQDSLGAGASKVREDAHGLEVWAKPLGSVGSGIDAVMLLNLKTTPADIAVQWRDLGFSGKATVRDLWAHKDLGEFPESYRARIPAHGSVLLKVAGTFNWTKGASYESEWPGNIRGGNATLLACPECSHGYAVSLRGANNISEGSSLDFTHIGVPGSGRYWMTIFYAHNDSGDKTVRMRVNQEQPVKVLLQESIYGSTAIPIELKKGDNSITFSFTGVGAANIDRVQLYR